MSEQDVAEKDVEKINGEDETKGDMREKEDSDTMAENFPVLQEVTGEEDTYVENTAEEDKENTPLENSTLQERNEAVGDEEVDSQGSRDNSKRRMSEQPDDKKKPIEPKKISLDKDKDTNLPSTSGVDNLNVEGRAQRKSALEVWKMLAGLGKFEIDKKAETEEDHEAEKKDTAIIAANAPMQEATGEEDTDVGKRENSSVEDKITWEEPTETSVEKADEEKMAHEKKTFGKGNITQEKAEAEEKTADEDTIAQDQKLAAEDMEELFWEGVFIGDEGIEEDTVLEKTADEVKVAQENNTAAEETTDKNVEQGAIAQVEEAGAIVETIVDDLARAIAATIDDDEMRQEIKNSAEDIITGEEKAQAVVNNEGERPYYEILAEEFRREIDLFFEEHYGGVTPDEGIEEYEPEIEEEEKEA